MLALFFVSRRNEFTADAGAVKLTGDAESMMTALARISRLNTMPIHWGKLDEKTLTHPSTMRRITRLARVGGISEARIPELLSQSLAAPAHVYEIPGNLASAGKVFSTQWKARRGTVIAWTMSSTLAALAAGVGSLSQWNQLSGAALYSVYLAGIALTIVWGLVLSNFLPMIGASGLEKRLRKKLEKEGAAAEVRGGHFVSLAPDSGPRIYESYWTWDIGFLTVTEGRLGYWGEEARFAIPRERIARISVGPGPVGWLKTSSVYVAWRDDSGHEHVFNLRPFRGRSSLEAARQTRKLAAELEEWQRGGRLAAGSLISCGSSAARLTEDIGEPHFGEITSISPRAAVRGARLVRIFLFDTILAVGMAVAFGLPFPVLSGSFPASDGAHLNPAGGGFLYILVTMWITRAFLMVPYWRFREGARSAIAGGASESRS